MSATSSARRRFGTTRLRRSRRGRATVAASLARPSRVRLGQHTDAGQPRAQLMLEACRNRVTTARQSPDHDPVSCVKLCDQAPCHVAQASCDSMSLHGRTHRLAHHQTDSRAGFAVLLAPLRVHDKVPLDGPPPVSHRGTELRRPGHPVPRRKHRRRPYRLRQSASGGPCADDWTRSRARRASSSGAETRAPALVCGCSAGRSACPWPRQ